MRSHECESGTHECVRHNFALVTISLRQPTSVVSLELIGSGAVPPDRVRRPRRPAF